MRIIAVLVLGILCFTSVDAIGNTGEIEEARIAGENDAKGFQWKWFAVSYMTANASVITGVVAAWANERLLANALDSLNDPMCFLPVFGAYTLAPTAVAILHAPTPPADRLLGKSPDWVNAYTKAYKTNMRGARAVSSAMGCVMGSVVLLSTLGVVLPEFTGD